MNTQPTLCLVMDGEKILCYEIHHSAEEVLSFIKSQTEYDPTATLLTIPLSVCAMAEEMREWLPVLVEKAEEYWDEGPPEEGWQSNALSGAVWAAKQFLSRLNQSQEGAA